MAQSVHKRFWLALILWAMVPSVWCQPQVVVLQFFGAPPHIVVDPKTQRPTGPVFELMETYVAPALGVKFDWQLTPIPRQLKAIEDGQTVASAWLAYTAERAATKNLLFTAKPYFPDAPGLAVTKSSRVDTIRTIDDILGLKIGYTSGAFLSPFMQDPRIHWDLTPGADFYPITFKKLLAGRVNAIYAGSSATLFYEVRQLNLGNDVHIVFLPEKKTEHFLVFSSKLKDLADRYNKAFDEKDFRAVYLKLLNQYMDTSVLSR